MVRKFEFKSNLLELDIAGEKFEVDAFEPSLAKRVDKHRVTLEQRGKGLQDIKDDNQAEELEKGLEKAIQSCVDVIDDVLGEGATKKIFKDRAINFLDAVQVAGFVLNEITDYIVEDVANKYSPNRAQRRAKR